MSRGALDGLRVLELGHEIAAPYCGKLLADLGADVIKVERPGGDPLRSWGPYRDDRADPDAAGLFRYLNANKRSVVLDLKTARGAAQARELAVAADLVIENLRPGRLESFGLGLDDLREQNPLLALVRISSFGQTGPYRDLPATDLVLQTAGGLVASHAAAGEPVRIGGRMAEYVSGAFAACSALTAVQSARQRGEVVEVDLSMLECVVGTLAYPMLAVEVMRALPARAATPARAPFGILRCKDGWVGINILTQAHWANACRAIGAPEFAESRGEVSQSESEYRAFMAKLGPWLDHHTADEILQQCQALRIPTAIVSTGRTLLESSQFRARPFFVDEPGGDFQQPGFPYRLSVSSPVLHSAAPSLRAASSELPTWLSRDHDPLNLGAPTGSGLPFQGTRVLDLGTFWAGPYIGMYLASVGADVIKVESIQRPDGFRFIGAFDPGGKDWYEAGTLFQATNLGKRNLTLDLSRAEGRDLLMRLVGSADILIENYAPRVMERFALDYAEIRAAKPDIVMVRMPAFGLEGPWRDYVGWAMAIAQASGISWITGQPSDELPRNPGAFIDPAVAMHALVAVQAALAHRRGTGEGQLIEMAQLETAACMCPEPIIDYSLNGRTQEREGNRSRDGGPDGIYPCAKGAHVGLSVRNDADWARLVEVLGKPEWAQDSGLATAAGRMQRAEELDAHLRVWTAGESASKLASRLQAGGVPAAELLLAPRMYDDPQLVAREYYQALDHPVTGTRRYPGWPMRFSFAGVRHPSGPPTLGQHNAEILGGELGISGEELERLRKEEIIGEHWKGGN